MPDTLIRRRDLSFLLHDVLTVSQLTHAPRYAEHSRETFDAAIDAAYRLAEEQFAPHNRAGDSREPELVDGQVQLIAPVGRALKAFADAGFLAATFGEADGGMQLPRVVANACWALFKGANVATDTYATLSIGVANMIDAFGTPRQRERLLPALLSGRFFGTMVLTEPHAGSSLAEITSSAAPTGDGRYRIKGNKIFITAGDHELGENIIHLVLARLPDAPAGVKGISLFVVPKFREDGSTNDVSLAGLIHKMGSKGTTSAMLNFGERGECIGELLGQPHQGLACMFQMMNEARINVGIASSALACAGYLHSLAYARERMQGRETPDPRSPQVAIVKHADVRRMLLAQKCVAEGGLLLCLHGALLSDLHDVAPSAAERDNARLMLDLLTPVIKAWCAKHGTLANSLAVQVHGGYGYTREYAVEQFYRDNRLNSIHEGTDGIQAIDLLGRKVGMASGGAMQALGAQMAATITEARDVAHLTAAPEPTRAAHWATQLEQAWVALESTTQTLLALLPHEPRRALAHASLYLDTFGHTVVAWMWLRQALAAIRLLGTAQGDDIPFLRGKLAAAHHFFHAELPMAMAAHAVLRSLDPALAELDDAWL
ncbi:acyl-CoA dehydrogenase [Piscinibacter terrae]|uniref:Acyl-CoA dehydrogenase n=1 Tax=Piscinibacter terrae TaxID=2496871 RepID=A0A3N7JRR2_9BURK|nr:acyl-CoA dehydrogenase [Albitalea terrae]RQP23689.1 acyl-CoA dehydrogenase [Albitalea terrae]